MSPNIQQPQSNIHNNSPQPQYRISSDSDQEDSPSLRDRISSCSTWLRDSANSTASLFGDLWQNRSMLSPNTHIFPGQSISSDPLYREELRILRNDLRNTLSGQQFNLKVTGKEGSEAKRLIDGMLFNLDQVGASRNSILSEGRNTLYIGGRPYVILFGGNATFYEESQEIIKYYLSKGFNVVAFNYSGYGESEGEATQENIKKEDLFE
jgi:hypothetical protein